MMEFFSNPENLKDVVVALVSLALALLAVLALYVKATPKKEDDAKFLKFLRMLKQYAPQSVKPKLEALEKRFDKPKEGPK